MRMTESRLRSLIRSVIRESFEEADDDFVPAGWGENHTRTRDLLDSFFDVDLINIFMRERGGSFIKYVNDLIDNDEYEEGFYELKKIHNFVSNFVKKGVYSFFTGEGFENFESASDKWERFKEKSSNEVFFEFIDNIIRSVIKESLDSIDYLDSTDWRSVDKKKRITLRDVLEYFEHNSIEPKEFVTQDLFYKLSGGKEVLNIIKKGGEESDRRVEAASLEYPVIVVMRNGKIEYVLDGNHRLQKAKNDDVEFIKVNVLDLDDPRIPEAFVRMF